MNDLISRQAVLSEIEKVCFSDDWRKFRINNGSNGERDLIINYIKHLPSVQPEQKWIPVSERLPKSSGVYIVTREFNDGIDCADLTDACYFDGTSTWHNDNRINHDREYVDKKIKAWMPLPEPYKAESEDKECR